MIELPAPTENLLIHAAHDAGQNLADFVEYLIHEYTDDKKDAQLAETAYQEFLDSGEKSISLANVLADNDL